jgi:hypothetical protein
MIQMSRTVVTRTCLTGSDVDALVGLDTVRRAFVVVTRLDERVRYR